MSAIVPWTKDRLENLSHKDLSTLYERALTMDTDEARDVVELVQQYGLLPRLGGGYHRGHRVIHTIEGICRSKEGVAAAIESAKCGKAPMAGVDPLIKDVLGEEYGHRDTTGWAGTFVAEEMEAEGWIRKGRNKLPESCVAKTAAFFVSKEDC
jgi:hypothetical protein